MSIDGVSGKTSYIGTSIINMRAQLEALTTQLATGKASTTYAGQGIDRGFALSLRAQINTINSFSDTAKNVNTRLSVANPSGQGVALTGGRSAVRNLQRLSPTAAVSGSPRRYPGSRPDHGPGGVRKRGRVSQQPVRRPLSVFRPRH